MFVTNQLDCRFLPTLVVVVLVAAFGGVPSNAWAMQSFEDTSIEEVFEKFSDAHGFAKVDSEIEYLQLTWAMKRNEGALRREADSKRDSKTPEAQAIEGSAESSRGTGAKETKRSPDWHTSGMAGYTSPDKTNSYTLLTKSRFQDKEIAQFQFKARMLGDPIGWYEKSLGAMFTPTDIKFGHSTFGKFWQHPDYGRSCLNLAGSTIDIDDAPAWLLSDRDTEYYIDCESGLVKMYRHRVKAIVEINGEFPSGVQTVKITEYQDFAGVKFPKKGEVIVQVTDGITLEYDVRVTITKNKYSK